MSTESGVPASQNTFLTRDTLNSTALAFVAGFVDAAGFVALAGLFTSHVTGNFVLIGAEIVTQSSGVLAKLLALPVFVLAVALARLLALGLEGRGKNPLRLLLFLEMLLLAGFMGIGMLVPKPVDPDTALAILSGMLGVAAMGVQNAMARLPLAHLVTTTVMTTNVTQTVIDTVDVMQNGWANAGASAARLGRMAPAIAAFGIGAVAAPTTIALWSFPAVVIPISVLAVVILLPAHKAA